MIFITKISLTCRSQEDRKMSQQNVCAHSWHSVTDGITRGWQYTCFMCLLWTQV